MSKVSVIIPSRNERFLVPTVNDLFAKAHGQIEVIVVLDGGPWPTDPPLPNRDDLIVIRHPESLGTRAAINAAVEASSGEFIMKSDAHCLYAEGYDEALKASCAEQTVVVPRRKRLDAENWCIEETTRPDCDYEYIQWHPTDFGGRGHNITRWEERNRDESLKSILTDDLMAFQASCYFTRRDYWEYLELMDEATYGKTQNEGEEVALKCWLSGGRVVIEKATWFAHLWKGSRYPRDYKFDPADLDAGASAVRRWLTDSAWHKQSLPFSWLIKKFNPPGWPAALGPVEPMTVPTTMTEEPKDNPLPIPLATAVNTPAPTRHNDTLRHILGKFNLDPDADYSKVAMPITLRMNRTELASLFAELGFKTGAEIGTAAGDYAETLCKANPDLKLYCVDKWEPYHGYSDHTHKSTLDRFYDEAKAKLAPYNVEMIRKWSVEAAADFEDESLDFVYIDCNHRYEYVVADIAAWLPKVRVGGAVTGHDFNQSRQSRKKRFGVVEAVIGYCGAYDIFPWFALKGEWVLVGDKTPSWMFIKT